MQYPLYLIWRNKNDTIAYLRRLFLEHIHEGKGGAYFDFSGDISGLLQHIPDNRDTVLFLPMDTEYPIGLNPLYRPQDRRATLENIVNALRSVWPSDIATTRIDLYLKAAILSLLDMPTAILLVVSELFTNDQYRTKVFGHLKDPVRATALSGLRPPPAELCRLLSRCVVAFTPSSYRYMSKR